ncbi:MAG: hypothetical protein KAI83_19980, partial [Thiomargarita sp.]|nr:hypothetical protein [Thiomargarita sp.]
MKKTPKSSTQQENLIEPPIIIDFIQLLTESKLSENEQGIVKRRLIENREQFSKVLQLLARRIKREPGILDFPQSLKQLEENEGREIRSFDSIVKILSRDFPQLLQFILDEYEVEAKNTRALIGKEFIFIKRIADVIFEAKDKNGCEVIVHLEFESEYKSDEHMDKRKLEYRQLMEMDEDYQGKVVLCNVFYLRGSPENKEIIEERQVHLPNSDPRHSSELRYKAYHLSLITIETIINRNLPFLLPFVVESELRSIDDASTTSSLMISLQKQIDEHEKELNQMIDTLSAAQMESLRTTVEYLWRKSYSKKVFNKSTLLMLMKKQLNFRERDIQLGRVEGLAKGRIEGLAKGRTEGRAKGRTEGRTEGRA